MKMKMFLEKRMLRFASNNVHEKWNCVKIWKRFNLCKANAEDCFCSVFCVCMTVCVYHHIPIYIKLAILFEITYNIYNKVIYIHSFNYALMNFFVNS